MDFVFMLTRDDATVADALDIVEAVRPLALKHIGFKDIGLAPETLRGLTDAIRAAGASVVAFGGSVDPAAEADLWERGVACVPIVAEPVDLATAMRTAPALIRAAAARCARLLDRV